MKTMGKDEEERRKVGDSYCRPDGDVRGGTLEHGTLGRGTVGVALFFLSALHPRRPLVHCYDAPGQLKVRP